MSTYFYRHGETITQIDGEHVAHVSSELPSKKRWTEFDLFLVRHDDVEEWILQGIGRSNLDGEIDRYWAIISDDPADILQSIVGQNVSRLAKKLLAESFKKLSECVCEDE